MTHRERIETVLAGELPDRVPAIFRLDHWYRARVHANDLPAELAGMTLADVEDYLGLAQSARDAAVFETVLQRPVEQVDRREGDRLITEWRTPHGTLRRLRQYGPGDEAAGLDPRIIEYPIKTWDDWPAYVDVMQHTEFVPTYDAYERYDQMIGEAGLPLVIVGAIPFHELMLEWTGYENGYLSLYDRPEVVLEAVEAANTVYRRMWRIVADSPARLVLHGVNFTTQMTSPPVFREHFLPYLRAFNDMMHAAGKTTVVHADGDLTGLLELMLEAGFDLTDCLACDPLVRCTIAEARAVWQDRLTIWGALPAILLEPYSPIERLDAYLEELYRVMAPGDRFILALTDMAMPTTSWRHLERVGEWVRDRSACPLTVSPTRV